jgi:hypothetical protein
MVDIESDGPAPGLYSMVQLGAVLVDSKLDKTFYAEFCPISDKFVPEALAVSGLTREKTLTFPGAVFGMKAFAEWIKAHNKEHPRFISDNNGFDWQFVNYYFHDILGSNPFGHSSTNLNSLYKGMAKSMFVNCKHLRKTKHTHHPVDDAMGNAEALLKMQSMGLTINLE